MTVIVPPGGTAIVRSAINAIVRECDGSRASRPVADGVALVLLAADYLAGTPAPLVQLSDLPIIMRTPTVPRSISPGLDSEALSLFLFRSVQQAGQDPSAFLSEASIAQALDADPILRSEHEKREMEQTIKRLKAEVEALRQQPPVVQDCTIPELFVSKD